MLPGTKSSTLNTNSSKIEDMVECTMYALLPLKERKQNEFITYLQLMSAYPPSPTIFEYVYEFSTLPQCSSNIHKSQIIIRNIVENDKNVQQKFEVSMKYFPNTLIRKEKVLKKVNARAWNIFKMKNSERDFPHGETFLKRSGYKEEFCYRKNANEFYFDGVGDDIVTLSIFKLK